MVEIDPITASKILSWLKGEEIPEIDILEAIDELEEALIGTNAEPFDDDLEYRDDEEFDEKIRYLLETVKDRFDVYKRRFPNHVWLIVRVEMAILKVLQKLLREL